MTTLTHLARRAAGWGRLGGALAVWALAGCSPSLNWREVRLDDEGLAVMLPCKPDRGARPVELAGQSVELGMVGCDVGDATYAVAYTRWPAQAPVGEALAQWRQATLARMGAVEPAPAGTPFVPAGALQVPQSLALQVSGQRPGNGARVEARLAWFARSSARGTQVFQVALFAPHVDAEVADTLLAGVRFP